MASLIKLEPALGGSFLQGLKIRTGDDIKIRIKSGVVTAHVKRSNGSVNTATVMLEGQFKQVTSYDPAGLSPKDRRKIVKKLKKDGHTQVAIADLLGVSQSTVSLDLGK